MQSPPGNKMGMVAFFGNSLKKKCHHPKEISNIRENG